jgi:hypothetical protein
MDEIVPYSNGDNGESADRNALGRFKPGWRGGPGSPQARHARELRERLDDALQDVCTPQRLRKAVDACLKLAEGGDIQALTLLANRLDPQKLHLKLEAEPPQEHGMLSTEMIEALFVARQIVAQRRQQREQLAGKS